LVIFIAISSTEVSTEVLWALNLRTSPWKSLWTTLLKTLNLLPITEEKMIKATKKEIEEEMQFFKSKSAISLKNFFDNEFNTFLESLQKTLKEYGLKETNIKLQITNYKDSIEASTPVLIPTDKGFVILSKNDFDLNLT
jgi:hypothetical protein